MLNQIYINIPKDFNYNLEIRNDLTKFFDNYNIQLPSIDDTYKYLYTTYINIDDSDIMDLIEINNNDKVLLFRIVGATRGGIYLHEVSRDVHVDTDECNTMVYTIKYIISNIKFNNSTCFDTFNVYSKDICDAVQNELYNKEVIITFYK